MIKKQVAISTPAAIMHKLRSVPACRVPFPHDRQGRALSGHYFGRCS
jgi:hypothetical protein